MATDVLFLALLAAAVGSVIALIPLWRIRQKRRLEAAFRLFYQRREWLEAKFYDLASSTGRPRGLRWKDCDFSNEVMFARELRNRTLTAFVGVTILSIYWSAKRALGIRASFLPPVPAWSERTRRTAASGFLSTDRQGRSASGAASSERSWSTEACLDC